MAWLDGETGGLGGMLDSLGLWISGGSCLSLGGYGFSGLELLPPINK